MWNTNKETSVVWVKENYSCTHFLHRKRLRQNISPCSFPSALAITSVYPIQVVLDVSFPFCLLNNKMERFQKTACFPCVKDYPESDIFPWKNLVSSLLLMTYTFDSRNQSHLNIWEQKEIRLGLDWCKPIETDR